MLRRPSDGYVSYTELGEAVLKRPGERRSQDGGRRRRSAGQAQRAFMEGRSRTCELSIAHHPMWAMRVRSHLLTLGKTVMRRSGAWSGASTGRDVRGA